MSQRLEGNRGWRLALGGLLGALATAVIAGAGVIALSNPATLGIDPTRQGIGSIQVVATLGAGLVLISATLSGAALGTGLLLLTRPILPAPVMSISTSSTSQLDASSSNNLTLPPRTSTSASPSSTPSAQSSVLDGNTRALRVEALTAICRNFHDRARLYSETDFERRVLAEMWFDIYRYELELLMADVQPEPARARSMILAGLIRDRQEWYHRKFFEYIENIKGKFSRKGFLYPAVLDDFQQLWAELTSLAEILERSNAVEYRDDLPKVREAAEKVNVVIFKVSAGKGVAEPELLALVAELDVLFKTLRRDWPDVPQEFFGQVKPKPLALAAGSEFAFTGPTFEETAPFQHTARYPIPPQFPTDDDVDQDDVVQDQTAVSDDDLENGPETPPPSKSFPDPPTSSTPPTRADFPQPWSPPVRQPPNPNALPPSRHYDDELPPASDERDSPRPFGPE